jgi:hypothetical protein
MTYKFTKTHRKNLSLALKGKLAWNRGKNCSAYCWGHNFNRGSKTCDICNKIFASHIAMTNHRRWHDLLEYEQFQDKFSENISALAKARYKDPTKNPFYNKCHSEKSRRKMSITLSDGRMAGKNNPSYGIPHYPALVYVKELGYKVRSSWEKEVFCNLKDNEIDCDYEPIAFDLKNGHTYTPDGIINDDIVIEVKGPISDWQIEKMKLFKKLYSQYIFIAITSNRRNNFKKLKFCDKVFDIEDKDSYISYLKRLCA